MELRDISDYVIKNPIIWIRKMIPDDDTLKSQKVVQLSDLPETIQQDIQIIIRYIASKVVVEDDEDDRSYKTEDRNGD